MAIAPVPSITFETVRAVSLGDTVREGQILEAKVTAMLTETVARLTIDGRPLDVATPKPLPVGALMTLRAEREGGQLRLITQGPIRAGPETAALPAPGSGDAIMDPLKAVLAKVQALAVEAALDLRQGGEAAQPRPSAAAAFAALAEQASSSQRMAEQAGGQRPPGAVISAPQQGTSDEPAMPGRPATPAAPQGTGQTPLPTVASGAQQPALAAASPAGQTPSTAPEEATSGARPASATPPQQLASAAPQQPLPAPGLAAESPEAPPSTPPAGPTTRQPTASPTAPQAEKLAPGSPANPSGLQTLALEAALNQRASAEGEPVQASGAKTPDPALGALRAALAENASGDDLAMQDDGARLRPSAAEARPAAAASTPPAPADAKPPDPAALAAKIAAAAQESAPEARQASAPAGPPLDLPPIQASVSDPVAAQARPERAAAQFSFEIPFFFPGNPQPLRLEVTQDEEGETQDGETSKPRSWTIRFAAEAGPLGIIHAAISQKGDQIGVQLWAERGETAALFKHSARDLQDSLEASNLKLEALKIAEGRPDEKAPRRAGEAAAGGGPREDFV